MKKLGCTSDIGRRTRGNLKAPSGGRYELCRSAHAEANDIISASRKDMIGSVLYLVGMDAKDGKILSDATHCSMCRRMIINAGISRVVARSGFDSWTDTVVWDWIIYGDTSRPTLRADR